MAGSTAHDPRLSQAAGQAGRQMRPYQIAERVGGQAAREDNNTLLGGPPSPKAMQAGTLPGGQMQNGRPNPPAMNTYPSIEGRTAVVNEFGQPAPDPSRTLDGPTNDASPPAFSSPPTTTSLGRFAVVNATHRDELDSSPRSSRLHEPQLTAAEEKQRLREQMNDPNGYASVPPPGGPPPAAAQPHLNGIKQAAQNSALAGGTSSSKQREKPSWETAEEEKQRLFEGARAAAELTQRRAMNTIAAGGSISKGNSPKSKQVSLTLFIDFFLHY